MTAALGMLGMATQLMGNRHQDMFNRKAANVAFDRQNMLRNTAHQAEVADLRAAGLNPILSATGGAGAHTPSVASPSGVSSQPIDFAGASAKSASTELTKTQDALARGEIEHQGMIMDNTRRQGALIEAQTSDTAAAAAKKGVETEQLRLLTPGLTAQQQADIRQKLASGTASLASASQAAATTATIQQQLLAMKEEYKNQLNRGEISASNYGKVLKYIEALTESIGFKSSAGVGYKGN